MAVEGVSRHASHAGAQATVAVVVPTRNRPPRLRRCLDALAAARDRHPFRVYVADSSTTEELRAAVSDVCAEYDFVSLRHHHGTGPASARNVLTEMATAELLVNVDDDVYVEPHAIDRLVRAYRAAEGGGWRAVAGSVSWAGNWSRPVVMRSIGWGREAEDWEEPSFLVSALVLYPRALAIGCPWFELVDRGEDRVAGALWRSKGVRLMFEPSARALHDQKHNKYDVGVQKDHLFANLIDAVVANPSPSRAVAYDVLGFLAGAKTYFRNPRDAYLYVRAWALGHVMLARHWRAVRAAVKAPLPPPPD